MFSCITPCRKPTADESDEEHQRPQSETPRTRQAAKSITTQVLNPISSLSLSHAHTFSVFPSPTVYAFAASFSIWVKKQRKSLSH